MKKLILLLVLVCSTWNMFGQFRYNFQKQLSTNVSISVLTNYVEVIDTIDMKFCKNFSINSVNSSTFLIQSTGLMGGSNIAQMITDSLSQIVRVNDDFLFVRSIGTPNQSEPLLNIYQTTPSLNKLIIKSKYFYGSAQFPANSKLISLLTIIGTYQ